MKQRLYDYRVGVGHKYLRRWPGASQSYFTLISLHVTTASVLLKLKGNSHDYRIKHISANSYLNKKHT